MIMLKQIVFSLMAVSFGVMPLFAQTPQKAEANPPLYLKVKILPEQRDAVAIHISGRRPARPWPIPRSNITRDGLFTGEGINSGLGNVNTFLKPGEESPWMNIAPLLCENGDNRLRFCAVTGSVSTAPLPAEANFTLCFSRTPDMRGIIKSFTRQGHGAGMLCMINMKNPDMISNDQQGSEDDLKYAQADPDVPGRRPEKFNIGTALELDYEISSQTTVDNELRALALLNLNGLKCPPSTAASSAFGDNGFRYYYGGLHSYFTKIPDCQSSLDYDKIEGAVKKYAEDLKKNGLLDKVCFIGMRDEPGTVLGHFLKCGECGKQFVEFLKKSEITPEALKIKDYAEAKLQKDSSVNPYLYYYTMRFRNRTMADAFRASTEAIRKELPGMPTLTNFSTELLHNMATRGADIFEIQRSGALTYGCTEDWCNWSGTYQLAGFQMAVMRAACRPLNQKYGMLNILVSRTPWEIQAKGFVETGLGASFIRFFNYGPYYAPSNDQTSQRPEIYPPIKRFAAATGAVEDHLLQGTVADGDAAMLYSVTSDIWNLDGKGDRDAPFGPERTYLYLLLKHLGCRTDILADEDIKKEFLDKYKLLFIVDSHFPRTSLEALTEWVKRGGTLYLGAGAMQYDEFNRPLELDGKLGIRRGKYRFVTSPGRPPFELLKVNPMSEVNFSGGKIPVICGLEDAPAGINADFIAGNAGTPSVYVQKCGNGRVISCGFFPALSYIQAAMLAKGKPVKLDLQAEDDAPVANAVNFYSCRQYPEAQRKLFAEILKLSGCDVRLKTSDHLVESNMIDALGAVIIALANWNGAVREVTVTIKGYPAFKKIYAVSGKIEIIKNTKDISIFKIMVGPGDYVVAEK
jgi:hypothetical protein